MTRVQWGVLGCSSFARGVALPALSAARGARLHAVASRDATRARELADRFSARRAYGAYEDLLADPGVDAVYIPLPNSLHAAWSVRAIEAGKHVLCEKPFAMTRSEAVRVADAAARRGVQVMEAFMWRFHPQHDLALRRIREGAIGAVRLVRAAFTFTIARERNIRLAPSLGGGSLLDIGCYPVSAARFYLGAEPVRAYARAVFDPEYRVDMAVAGVLEFPEGDGLFDCGFRLPYRADLEVCGESGVIQIPAAWLPPEQAHIVVNGDTHGFGACNQYVQEFEHFSRCVRNEEPARFGIEDAVLQARAMDAVRRSAETGQPEPV
ncbi:MAG TPA: Gfo/Idh/MocA family oxidoreductase [Chthonomonadales bacterium]|nr:Gfo/Idh/MocA family oxidoreductase [Chthonomonadales bacterium]